MSLWDIKNDNYTICLSIFIILYNTMSIPSEVLSQPSKSVILSKYQNASTIVRETLYQLIDCAKPNHDVADLCKTGDDLMLSKLQNVYTKLESGKKVIKGICFPTCISINELLDNYSPTDSPSRLIQEGDIVKIHLGCHIDGYAATLAHTIIVGEKLLDDRKANVVKAAWTAAEAICGAIRNGISSTVVNEIVKACSTEFQCRAVDDVYCYQIKQHVLEGATMFRIQLHNDEKVSPIQFQSDEIYCINVCMSTGEGKVKQSDLKTTIFRRNIEQSYLLKTPMARQFLREVMNNYPTFPFSVRYIKDKKMRHLGISECCRHNLLERYPVLTEKAGEFIAQFQYYILVLPDGSKKITGIPLVQESVLQPYHHLTNSILIQYIDMINISKKKKIKKVKEIISDDKNCVPN